MPDPSSVRPSSLRLLLVGFGPVGRAFARLVEERRDLLLARGLDTRIVAVATSRATWLGGGEGGGAARLAETVDDGASFADQPGVRRGWDGTRAIAEIDADVVIEATASNYRDGEPATGHLRAALSRGLDVIVAGKGALVLHHAELRGLAERHGARLRFGAATAAALPTIDVAEFGLAGATVARVDGVLNGTSNYVLTLMRREGVTIDAALERARRQGIAEADASLDLGGWDTAAKLVLIAGAMWGTAPTLDEVVRTGIEGLTADEVGEATRRGVTVRLLGSLWRDATGTPRARVAPIELEDDHPLAHVEYAEKGATFETDTLGRVTVVGGASSPRGAAAALVRDLVNLMRERR